MARTVPGTGPGILGPSRRTRNTVRPGRPRRRNSHPRRNSHRPPARAARRSPGLLPPAVPLPGTYEDEQRGPDWPASASPFRGAVSTGQHRGNRRRASEASHSGPHHPSEARREITGPDRSVLGGAPPGRRQSTPAPGQPGRASEASRPDPFHSTEHRAHERKRATPHPPPGHKTFLELRRRTGCTDPQGKGDPRAGGRSGPPRRARTHLRET